MRWKVLIVEDDMNFRYAIRELVPWRENNFEIVGEAVNGRQALEILKQKEVDIVLTDMEMPIMGGVELTEEIKKLYPSIRIIALSAFDDFKFVKESMRLGAEDYILKQEFDENKIIEVLQNLCKKHLKEQRSELNRYSFQRELLNYIQQKATVELSENNPYYHIKTKDNMMLCLVKSSMKVPMQKEEEYDGNLIFCMKAEEDIWIFLYQLPKSYKKSEEISFQETILSKMREKLQEETKIGVSDLTGDFSKLPALYQMAKTALMYFMYFPDEEIIHYLDIRKFEEIRVKDYLYYPKEYFLDIYPEQLEDVLLEYEKNLEKYMPDEEYVNKGFFNIYKELKKGISIKNADFEVLNYYEEIQKIGSIREKFDFTRKLAQMAKPQYLKRYKGKNQEMRRALEYISLHYAEDISLGNIADYIGLSENYFSNLFKQEMGETLMSYINKVRIENAKKLLQNQSLKVYEIAEKVGYKNTTYLSTMFKKVTGISIREFKAGKGDREALDL